MVTAMLAFPPDFTTLLVHVPIQSTSQADAACAQSVGAERIHPDLRFIGNAAEADVSVSWSRRIGNMEVLRAQHQPARRSWEI